MTVGHLQRHINIAGHRKHSQMTSWLEFPNVTLYTRHVWNLTGEPSRGLVVMDEVLMVAETIAARWIGLHASIMHPLCLCLSLSVSLSLSLSVSVSVSLSLYIFSVSTTVSLSCYHPHSFTQSIIHVINQSINQSTNYWINQSQTLSSTCSLGSLLIYSYTNTIVGTLLVCVGVEMQVYHARVSYFPCY